MHSEALTLATFGQVLHDRGTRLDLPLLFSFDCDQTLVDRERGTHFTSPDVVQMFARLRATSQCHIAINTGRDAASYAPIGRNLDHDAPCIFVSGRVVRLNSHSPELVFGALPLAVKEQIWRLFTLGVCPFLDVKTPAGYYYLTSDARGVSKYFGHHRSPSWFVDVETRIVAIERAERAKEAYFDEPSVRIDAPLWRDQNAQIVEAIDRKDLDSVREELVALFNASPDQNLMFLPAPTFAGNAQDLSALGSVRIMVASTEVNKGTGLRALAEILGIREANILSFGDSSGLVASDQSVKVHLPGSLLFITEEGDAEAKASADSLIGSVQDDGVPKAVAQLLRLKELMGG